LCEAVFWLKFDLSPALAAEAGAVQQIETSRREEFLVFLLLTVVVAPLLAVAFVSGYGFIVWMVHLIGGPPGPPGG
jgi:periplasmic nitrate reductase NapE